MIPIPSQDLSPDVQGHHSLILLLVLWKGYDVLTIILDHIRDSLVQVGLLDSSIIDLTNDQASGNFDHA